MSETRTRIQPARRVAYEVISAVRESDAYANLLLPVRLDRAKLSGPDAALATELTYGTLRMIGYYDRVIELAARRPAGQIDAPILDV
ncbi:MAG TPA: transcription antitermination factor NusB, partial [Terrimesophilobacter sp.]|nr:transcription antitermination factor NusB [Terrimesophilobacter sp.]